MGFSKIHQKTPHGVNHEAFRNLGAIVLIDLLRQLTMSVCRTISYRKHLSDPLYEV